MTNKKSFLLACSLVLMISLTNSAFLKQKDPLDFDVKCPPIVKETIQAMEPTLQNVKAAVKQTVAPSTETKAIQVPAEPAAPAAEQKPEKPAAEEASEEAGQEIEAGAQAPAEEKAPESAPAATTENQGGDYKNNLRDLQSRLEDEIQKLNLKQVEEKNKVDVIEARETKKLVETVNKKEAEVLGTAVPACAAAPAAAAETPAAAKPAETPAAKPAETPAGPVLTKGTTVAVGAPNGKSGCEITQSNLLQVGGVDAIEDFGKMLNLKVAPPTIANSISTTTSIAKGNADDNSLANTVQTVKSTTTADASGEKNAIAVSNVVGNSEAKSNNLAVDNSKATTVVDNAKNLTATANASENSLAAAAVKADQKSETNTVAGNNSTAVGGTQMTSDSKSTAKAVEGSIADTKVIADDKSITNTGAAANSTAIGVTAVKTETNSIADAANKSLAQSVAESANAAKTTTVALDNSASVGATVVDTGSNSTALASDGGNALSTSSANNCVATESVAKNNSASVVQNNGGSQSNATSVSVGTAAAYENPIQAQGQADTNATTNGVNLQQAGGKTNSADKTDACETNGVKIPSILDTATKVTLKSEGGSNIMDNLIAEKEKCGTLEDHKTDVLKAAAGTSTAAKCLDEQSTKEKADRDRIKAEERKLREENKRLKQERGDREDRERAARKADERRKRKARKHKKSSSKCRNERNFDCDSSDMSAPRVQSGRMYGDDCELNQKVNKDFQESLKQESQPDERFDDKNMFKDNIKEYDSRCNDERVNDDCTDICKKEKLGNFVSSEIQDVLKGNFLFKCNCVNGSSDWYMYDSKTDKSRPLSSTSRVLLDEPEKAGNVCDEVPYPQREAAEGGNAAAAPILQAAAPASPAAETRAPMLPEQCYNDDEDLGDDCDSDSRCGNFVSERIDAAKRRAKGGCDDTMHSNLGDCFNKFIENKFNKLHRRLNNIKNKNTGYVKDLHKKQLKKQASKVEDIVDKTSDCVSGPELSGAGVCNPTKGGDNLRNIQANMNDLKRDLNLTTGRKETPEDVYFQTRNAKDQERFDQRLQSRFDDKNKCGEDRFTSRFGNADRYNARDGGACAGVKKAADLKSDSGAFISSEVGRIKNQNTNYLSKIKDMFGGCQ